MPFNLHMGITYFNNLHNLLYIKILFYILFDDNNISINWIIKKQTAWYKLHTYIRKIWNMIFGIKGYTKIIAK